MVIDESCEDTSPRSHCSWHHRCYHRCCHRGVGACSLSRSFQWHSGGLSRNHCYCWPAPTFGVVAPDAPRCPRVCAARARVHSISAAILATYAAKLRDALKWGSSGRCAGRRREQRGGLTQRRSCIRCNRVGRNVRLQGRQQRGWRQGGQLHRHGGALPRGRRRRWRW